MSDKRQNFVRAKHYSDNLEEVTDKIKCFICKRRFDRSELELVLLRNGKKQYVCGKCAAESDEL